MAFLVERVIAYVTADPCLFVAEERLLQYGKNKDKDFWWIDVLIADPWQRMFYLGEATYDMRPRRLVEKLKRFASAKPEVLKRIGRGGIPVGWDVLPWLFLRKDAVNYVKDRLPADLKPRITAFEATAHPWEYEKNRMLGEEPPGADLSKNS